MDVSEKVQERSGHVAVLEEHLLYVWGGFTVSAGETVCLPADQLCVFDLERRSWQMFLMSGDVPLTVSGTCGCCVDGVLYVFGGCAEKFYTNEMFGVELGEKTFTWRHLSYNSGSAPSPRSQLCCWTHDARIVYFGGYGEKLLDEFDGSNSSFIIHQASWLEDVIWGWNNEVHVFDTLQSTWHEPRMFGRVPAARAGHASAVLGSRGYICGGNQQEHHLSDLHCLDLETWTWTQITSFAPAARSWHSLSAVSANTLFLFGGLGAGEQSLSDSWLLDIDTNSWTESSHDRKTRLFHSACSSSDSNVVVFGGSNDFIDNVFTDLFNDVLVFQLQPQSLFRICLSFFSDNMKTSDVVQSQIRLLPARLQSELQP